MTFVCQSSDPFVDVTRLKELRKIVSLAAPLLDYLSLDALFLYHLANQDQLLLPSNFYINNAL